MYTKNIVLAAALILCGLAPANAQTFEGVTCNDVRSLSAAQQNYWSARLNLSAEQRHRIYVACYQNQDNGGSRRTAANTYR